MTLYYIGAFTPAIWSTIAWTETFNNVLCTNFLRLCGLKSSHNSSRLKNLRCELSLKVEIWSELTWTDLRGCVSLNMLHTTVGSSEGLNF